MKNRSSAGAWAIALAGLLAGLLAVLARPAAAGLFEWSPLGRLGGSAGPEPYISAIAAHPSDPDILFAGSLLTTETAALVYRSADDGESWSAASEGLPDDLPDFTGVNDLLLAVSAGGESDVLLVGLDTAGVWRSDNAGERWQPAAGGSIGATVSVLALAQSDGAFFALTSNGVHRAGSDGNWQRLGNGLPDSGSVFYFDLAADPTQPGVLYAATSPNGLYRTADNGDTWYPANGDLPGASYNLREVSINPNTAEVFVALRGTGLFRSADDGQTWLSSHQGITYNTALFGTVGAPVICPNDPQVAYTFNSDGIFRSEDGGRTWSPYAEGLTGTETISALAFHPARPYTVYAGTSVSGVWRLTLARGGRYFLPMVR